VTTTQVGLAGWVSQNELVFSAYFPGPGERHASIVKLKKQHFTGRFANRFEPRVFRSGIFATGLRVRVDR
jgi:hypothetical protein